jgi:SM-20-related protein
VRNIFERHRYERRPVLCGRRERNGAPPVLPLRRVSVGSIECLRRLFNRGEHAMKVLGSSWMQREVLRHPYDWVATEQGELFDADMVEELSGTFPMSSFVRTDASARREGKTYRNYSRELVAPDGRTDLDLPLCWRALVEDLMSVEYRAAVARMLRQEVVPAVEIRLVRHGPDDWLGPHCDRADKVFSHIFYFNPVWRQEWGGCLEILGSAAPDSVVASAPPRLGTSALLTRSDESWHQVSRITSAAAPERRSLLVHGLRA